MAVRKRKDLPGEPWVAEFKDADTGKRRQVKPATGLKKDAQKIYDEAMRRTEERRQNPNGTQITVARLGDKWLVEQAARAEAGEIGRVYHEHQRSFLRLYINPVLGDKLLDDLTPADVEACFNTMLRRGLHPTSAKKRIRTLRLLETFARKNRWTARRVVTDACLDIRAEGYAPVKRFKMEEIRNLLTLADTRPSRVKLRSFMILRCALHLGVFCGLRVGEIQALTLDNIDLKDRILRVRYNLTRFEEHKTTKTKNGIRDVPIPDHLVLLLTAWIGAHYLENPRQLVFTQGDATPVSYIHFRRESWVPLLCRAGLAKPDDERFRHFHALRHFYSAAMLKQGVAVTDVAALMGHASPAITMQHYAHSLADENRHHGAVEGVAKSLLPAKGSPVPAPVATVTRQDRLTHWY